MDHTHHHGDPKAPAASRNESPQHEHSMHGDPQSPAPPADVPPRARHVSRAGHGDHDAHAGHDKHAGHSVAMFRNKFWISLALTAPTLIWGHMLQRAFGYTPPAIPGGAWIAPVFGTAVFLYGGVVFLQGAWRELRG